MPLTMRKKLMQRLSSWLDQLPSFPRRGQTRDSTRTRGKAASRSAAPAFRLPPPPDERRRPPPRAAPPPVPAPAPAMTVSAYGDPWEPRLSRGATRILENMPMGGSLSQAATRQTIRTNPWISRSSLRASSHCSATRLPMTTSTTSSSGVSSLSPSSSSTSSPYGVASSSRLKLDESVCSSGYGSNDSRSIPESSVHSPNWQQMREDKAVECRSIDLDAELGFLEETSSFGPYDEMGDSDEKEDDEHVYHELESLNRFSRVLEESRVPSSLSSGSISLPRPQKCLTSSIPRARSPVYARPFETINAHTRTVEINNREYVMPGSLPNSYYTSAYSPLPRGDFPTRRPRQLPLTPHNPYASSARPLYARPAPRFTAPPPPPYEEEVWRPKEKGVNKGEEALRKIEQDFLAELDAQIQELQIKSEAVRCLVDEARVRRASTEQWRRARWHNTFELCL
ncbi:hypothetical protein PFISCL1PPCAC_25131 [Pristionchus fissidentatus]|uniref:Uncharacterized protein n=1 Tax=Pristionchus fissidentatus TaxID=1538716 RepID=A0AAV5WW52_9BILA|nr:hypothetical protein PFISCL1PPCAC_25131 [Pristionchus fissidentatus]